MKKIIIYSGLILLFTSITCNAQESQTKTKIAWSQQLICNINTNKCNFVDLIQYQGENIIAGVMGIEMMFGENSHQVETVKKAWLINTRRKLEKVLKSQKKEIVQREDKGGIWWIKLKA